jgi:hypothetical protein
MEDVRSVKRLIHILSEIEDDIDMKSSVLDDEEKMKSLRLELQSEGLNDDEVEEEVELYRDLYRDHIIILQGQVSVLEEGLLGYGIDPKAAYAHKEWLCDNVQPVLQEERKLFEALLPKLPKQKRATSNNLQGEDNLLDAESLDATHDERQFYRATDEEVDHPIVRKYAFLDDPKNDSYPKDFRFHFYYIYIFNNVIVLKR